jgi:hypothetical protein
MREIVIDTETTGLDPLVLARRKHASGLTLDDLCSRHTDPHDQTISL